MVGTVSNALDSQSYSGSSDIVLLKYTESGDWQWTQQRGTSGADYGYGGEQLPMICMLRLQSRSACICAVALDATSGSVYVTGGVATSLDGQAYNNGYDMVLMKYDAAGDWQWTRMKGTATDDYGYGGKQQMRLHDGRCV